MNSHDQHSKLPGTLAFAVLLIGSSVSMADEAQTEPQYQPPKTVIRVTEAIDYTVENSPEILDAWHQLQAAVNEKRSAFSGHLPQVSLNALAAKTDSENPQFLDSSYDSTRTDLTITQNLYRGGQIQNQVNKFHQLSIARYYDLLTQAETMTQNVVLAYIDLMRFQSLVALAKDSFIQHTLLHRDIEKRAKAGITRTVDYEQAKARLALSESNLVTEGANLHDVTVRFIRLVGLTPSIRLATPSTPKHLIPEDLSTTLNQAYRLNPELLSAVAQLKAGRFELSEKKSERLPTLDLRARKALYDDNAAGLPASYDETALELVLSYPIYSGGRIRSTVHQFKQQRMSLEQRKILACRNLTQTVSIAFNEIRRATEQEKLTQRNLDAIGKVREAYKKQFDIGQRTLLDLLDTENEYFDVQRAHVNAKFDILTAEINLLAGLGKLTSSFSESKVLQEATVLVGDLPPSSTEHCHQTLAISNEVQKRDVLKETLQDKRLHVPKPAPPSVPVVESLNTNNLTFRLNVEFQPGSSKLLPAYQDELKSASDYLLKNHTATALIEGHTDSVGSAAYNLQLSQARADALKLKLVEVYGIDSNRLKTIGHGEFAPIASNGTAEGRAKNRRVVMVIPKGNKSQ